MLFDYGKREDFFLEFPLLQHFFDNNQQQVVNNLDEADVLGLLDNEVLNGVVAYHIRAYFNYIGKDQELFVMFADCSEGFEVLQEMQLQAEGKLFQVGVWTEQCLLKSGEGTYGLTNLIGNIQYNINEMSNLNGSVGNDSSMISALLFCNTAHLEDSDEEVDYKKFPSIIDSRAPKLSVVLGQEGSAAVHGIQDGNVGKTPVGLMGLMMACLTLASAENSIADVGQFNINRYDEVTNPELGFGKDYTPINDQNLIKIRRNVLSQKGFILLTDYEAKAGEVFFTNDQTLSTGDYGTISNNRLIHKVGRVVRRTMLPYVNSPIRIDPSTGYISSSSITELSNALYESIDANMITRKGQNQLYGRIVQIPQDQFILANDTLNASVTVTPVTSNASLTVTESVQMQ